MSNIILTADQVMEKALREATLMLLENCTEEQISGFHRIHANAPWKGYADCPMPHLKYSYDLVVRTIKAAERQRT